MDETPYDVRKGLQRIKDFMNKHIKNVKAPPSVMKKLQKLYKCTEKKSVSIEIIMKVEQAIDQLKFQNTEIKTDDSSNHYLKSSIQRPARHNNERDNVDSYRYDDLQGHSRHEYKLSSSRTHHRDKLDRSRSSSRSRSSTDRNDKYRYRHEKDQKRDRSRSSSRSSTDRNDKYRYRHEKDQKRDRSRSSSRSSTDRNDKYRYRHEKDQKRDRSRSSSRSSTDRNDKYRYRHEKEQKRDRSRSSSRSSTDRNDKYRYRHDKDQGKYKKLLDRSHSRKWYKHDDRTHKSDSEDDNSFKNFPNKSPYERKNKASMEHSDHREYIKKEEVCSYRYEDRSPRCCSRSKIRSRTSRYRTHAPDRSGNNKTDRNRSENKYRKSRTPSPDERSPDCRLDFKSNSSAPSPRYLPFSDQSSKMDFKSERIKKFNCRDGRSSSPDEITDDVCGVDPKNDTHVHPTGYLSSSLQDDESSSHQKSAEKFNIFNDEAIRSQSIDQRSEDDCKLSFKTYSPTSPTHLPFTNKNESAFSPENILLKHKLQSDVKSNCDDASTSVIPDTVTPPSIVSYDYDSNNGVTSGGVINMRSKLSNLIQSVLCKGNNSTKPSTTVTSDTSISSDHHFDSISQNVPVKRTDVAFDLMSKNTEVVGKKSQISITSINSIFIDEDIIKQIVDQSVRDIKASTANIESHIACDENEVKSVLATNEINDLSTRCNSDKKSSIVQTIHPKDPRQQRVETQKMQPPARQQYNSYILPIQSIPDYKQNPLSNDSGHDRLPTTKASSLPNSCNPLPVACHSNLLQRPRIQDRRDSTLMQPLSLPSIQYYNQSIQPMYGEEQNLYPKHGLLPDPLSVRKTSLYALPSEYRSYQPPNFVEPNKNQQTESFQRQTYEQSSGIPQSIILPQSGNIAHSSHIAYSSNIAQYSNIAHSSNIAQYSNIAQSSNIAHSNNIAHSSNSAHSSNVAPMSYGEYRRMQMANGSISNNRNNETVTRPSGIDFSKSNPRYNTMSIPNVSPKPTIPSFKIPKKPNQGNEHRERKSGASIKINVVGESPPPKLVENQSKVKGSSETNKANVKSSTDPRICLQSNKKASQGNKTIFKQSAEQQNNTGSSSSNNVQIKDNTITALKELMNPEKLLSLVGIMGQLSDNNTFTKVKEILEDRVKEPHAPISNEERTNDLSTSFDFKTPNITKTTKRKNELDRLNEDINNMFIRDGVLKANGRRLTVNYPIKETFKKRTIQTAMDFTDGIANKKQKTETQTSVSRTQTVSPIPDNDKNDFKPAPARMRGRSNTVFIPKPKTTMNVPKVAVESPKMPPQSSNKRKRRRNDFEIQELVELKPLTKNNNPEMHSLKKVVECQVCYKPSGWSLISHYVNMHPSSEVLISRLAPEAGKLFRSSGGVKPCEIVRQPGSHKYEYNQFCFFCNIYKCMAKSEWVYHMAKHTGYYHFKCIDCSRKFSGKPSHNCVTKNNIERIPQPQFEQQELTGYVCDLCNFVRFHKSEMEQHLSCEHDDSEPKSLTQGLFLSFPKRLLKRDVQQGYYKKTKICESDEEYESESEISDLSDILSEEDDESEFNEIDEYEEQTEKENEREYKQGLQFDRKFEKQLQNDAIDSDHSN